MHIEHLALWTGSLDRLAEFYAKYFNALIGPKYSNISNGFESYFLNFEHGARLEIMSTTELRPIAVPRGAQRMGLTHLAFSVGSESLVDGLTEQIRTDGYVVLAPPSPHRRWLL